MAAGWARPAGFALLVVVVLAAAASADRPARGGLSVTAGAEESSAVFPLYGDVYPHGYGSLPSHPLLDPFGPALIHSSPPAPRTNQLTANFGLIWAWISVCAPWRHR